MSDLNLSCDFEQSIINAELYICKRCGMVIHKNSLKFSAICPVLLDKAASDPKYPQVRLAKIETINPSINTTQETPVPEKAKNIDNDWWNNSINVINVQNNTLMNKPNSFQPQQISHPTRKQCSEEQINERMNICQGCEFFQDNTCLQCGCALSRDKTYMNKLLWADQSCPVGKWGPITT
jgi:hypothetical protein